VIASPLLALFTILSTSAASVNCSAVGPDSTAWSVTRTSIFEIRVPPDYRYRAILAKGSLTGKWVRRGEKGQSAIVFELGPPLKPMREYTVFQCEETIHGQPTRVETGIGPSQRYFARVTWLNPLPGNPTRELVVWADTADPAEQLEALTALRTLKIVIRRGA
jgi:hypothetical protein